MAYNREQPITAGEASAKFIMAVKDGVQPEDAPEGTALLLAMGNAADEFIANPARSGLYFGGGLAIGMADTMAGPEGQPE